MHILHYKENRFYKITVYGMLVDYTMEKVTKSYRLVLDFNKRSSILSRCEVTSLKIHDGLNRVASILDNAIVRS